METFADRLNSLIKGKRGISAFARECGIGDTTIRQYLAGAVPGLDKVIQIARAKRVSITWLATGEGPRDSQPETSHQGGTEVEQSGGGMQLTNTASFDDGRLILLPRMDVAAAAGSGRLAPDFPQIESYVALSEDYLRSIGVPPRYAQLLEIDGDSMFPTLKDRDVAVVDTSIVDVRSDAVYAVVYGGLVVAKRVQINRDGSIVLSSDNKAAGYRDERVAAGDLHELHIAGRIKGRVGGL